MKRIFLAVLAAGALAAAVFAAPAMLDFYAPGELRFSSEDMDFKAALVAAGTPPYNEMARILSAKEYDIVSELYSFTPAGKVFKKPAVIGFLRVGPRDKTLAVYTFSQDLKYFERLPTRRAGPEKDETRTVYIARVGSFRGRYFALLRARPVEPPPAVSTAPARKGK